MEQLKEREGRLWGKTGSGYEMASKYSMLDYLKHHPRHGLCSSSNNGRMTYLPARPLPALRSVPRMSRALVPFAVLGNLGERSALMPSIMCPLDALSPLSIFLL